MNDKNLIKIGTPKMRELLVSISRWGILVTFIALFLLFLPLIASIVEAVLFRSRHVYDLFYRIGLADILDTIYAPVKAVLQR